MSLVGPSRLFAAMQHFGRFRSEAVMDRQAKVAGEPLPRVTVGLAPRSRLQAKLKVYPAARQAI